MSRPAFSSRENIGEISIISFHSDTCFELPKEIMTCSIEEFQRVLCFASKLLQMQESLSDEYSRTTLFAEYLKDVEQKQSQDLLNLQRQSVKDMATTIQPLVSKISELEEGHKNALSTMKHEYETQIRVLQKAAAVAESDMNQSKLESESTIKRESRVLSKRISELEAELQLASKSETLIRERCQQESDRLLKAMEEKNKELFTIRDDILCQRERKIEAKEQEMQSKLQRQASSVLRGHDGEHFFAALAKEKMNWDLIKAPTFSCDYISTISGTLVLFEVKNYSNAIPKAEVSKFLRDMKMHPEALVGVFISLNTLIMGRNPKANFELEWINSSQCAIYIQSAADLDIEYTLSVIEQIIRITGTFHSTVLSQSSASEESMLQGRIEQAKAYLDRTVLRGNKLIRKITADRKQQVELIDANCAHSLSELKYQNADILSSVQILLGDYSEPDVILSVDSMSQESDDKPQKPAKKKAVKTATTCPT